jgi:hypothetical protein
MNDEIVKLAALHRHWILADAVRVVLRQKTSTPHEETITAAKFGLEYVAFGESASMVARIQVWYALLYVVIEGYNELKLPFAPLDKVLASADYVGLLRRFRNATFHYQADPLTDKLIDFLAKDDSENWIRELNRQFDAFFMQALPIQSTLDALAKTGVPDIPRDSKLSYLIGPRG